VSTAAPAGPIVGRDAELAHRAEANGCLVVTGAAADFERDLPFAVWADALDARVAAQALDLQAEWSRREV
jgi:hypothetical protein